MGERVKISNKDELEAWLRRVAKERGDEEGRRIAVWIAHRAAMRVAPSYLRWLIADGYVHRLDLTSLRWMRASLICGVVGTRPTPQLEKAAAAAVAAANAAAYSAQAATGDRSGQVVRAAAAVAAEAAAHTVVAATALKPTIAATAAAIATAHAAAAEDAWREVEIDAAADLTNFERPIWSSDNPSADVWSDVREFLDPAVWRFWARWYEAALDGTLYREENLELLTRIALIGRNPETGELIGEEEWDKGPAHIARLIDGLIDELRPLQWDDRGEPPDRTTLADAAPFDFTFDKLAKVMELVGIDGNLRHLRDPAIVYSFLDDAMEVRDGLRSFIKYAARMPGNSNYAGVLQLAAEEVLRELNNVDEDVHLRPELLVILAQDMEAFSKDEMVRADLPGPLADMLDARLIALKRLCRTHFGPSYITLAPLAELPPEKIDQDEVIRLFDEAIAKMRRLPSRELYALDVEGMKIVESMARELVDYRAATMEADTDEFKQRLEERFAFNSGALGLTFAKFWEQSAVARGQASETTGVALKQWRNAKTVGEIVAAVEALQNGG